jgi:TonB family protein
MMLTWMLSALAFGACVALVATAAQPFARVLGRPTRWIWTVALAVAALWPVVSTLALLLLPSLRESAAPLSAIRVVPDASVLGAATSAGAMQLVGQVVLALWALATLLLGVRLVRALVALRRVRDAAEQRVVDGVEVLVSDDIGPATIGLRRHAVLVPRSVLGLDEPLRRLVLRHECEHRVARDPWLLLATGIAVVLFPWNAALWVIARRLRLALETDCDARVLDAGGDPVRYGRLLLLLAQGQRAVPLALTLAAPPSQLERRIVAMRTRLARPRPLHLVVAGSVLVLGIAGACSAGAPDAPSARRPSGGEPRMVELPASTAPASAQGGGATQIPGTGMLRYPDAMRAANREGEVHTMFVVDERGLVDTSSFRVLKSTDPAFTAAVRAALPTMRFRPARKNGRAVRQVVEQPFTFSLARN